MEMLGELRPFEGFADCPEPYRLLADTLSDSAICLFDPRGNVASWNLAAERMEQFTAEEIIGKPRSCFYLPEDVAAGLPDAALAAALAEGKSEVEGWRLRRDGSHFRAHTTCTPLHDRKGKHVGFAEVTRDLSRDLAHEHLRMVLHHAQDGIIGFDAQGLISSFNLAAERIFGYEAAEITGQNVRLLVAIPQQSEVESSIREFLRIGEPRIIGAGNEASGRRKDGANFPVDLAISEFTFDDQTCYSCVVRDVTERDKRGLLLNSILESVEAGVVSADGQGLIQTFNRAAEQMFGYRREEVIGQSVELLMPEPFHSEHSSYIASYRETGQARAIGKIRQVAGLRKDGSVFPLELGLSEFKLADDSFYLAIMRDSTERSLYEDALRRSKQRLENAQRVAHVGDWVWDIANDRIDWSDEYFRILGLEPQSFKPDFARVLQHVHPEDRERIQRQAQLAVASGGSHLLNYRMLRPDGELRYIEGRGEFPVRAAGKSAADPGTPDSHLASGTVHDVTDRILEEVWTHTILDNVADSIIMIDEKGLIQSINRITEEMSGYSAAELVGQPYDMLIRSEQKAQLLALQQNLVSGEVSRITGIELLGLRKDGSVQPLELSLNAFKFRQSTYIISVARDVTQRNRATQELQQSLSLTRATIEATGEGVLAVDLQGRITAHNRQFDEMWEIPAGLFDGNDDRPVLHYVASRTRNPEQFEVRVTDLYQQPGATSFDLIELGDGRVFERYTNPQIIDGASVGRVWTFRDITQRLVTERELRESEERFAELAASMDEVFWMYGVEPEGLVYVSPGFERVYGVPVAGVMADNQLWFDAIHPEDRENFRKIIQDHISGVVTSNSHDEHRILRPDGSLHWVRDSVRSMYYSGGQLWALGGITEDITRSKLEQLERENLESQLRQGQKMEAIGKLAGGVAHDFNNMLTAILGYSEIALDELPTDSPLREIVNEIRLAGERAALITSQLLAFSRQQLLAPRVLNLNTVVTEMENMLGRFIGEDVMLATKLDPQLSPILVDQGQIVQVIMNLVVNARDAMPLGGKLTVQTQNFFVEEERALDHPDYHSGLHVLLSISDNGSGMAPEVRSRIFEPFFTTKPPGEGTGLGLSTVYGIVRQSGGHIEVYSEPGAGTTFKVYFPAVADAPLQEAPRAAALVASRGETILLVEDDATVRKIAATMLERDGYKLVVAKDGADALEIAWKYEGTIDLLLTDLIMPEISGRRVAEAVKELRPKVKVLFMSGYTDDAVFRHGLISDNAAFLQKPFTKSGLATKVREVLDS